MFMDHGQAQRAAGRKGSWLSRIRYNVSMKAGMSRYGKAIGREARVTSIGQHK